MVRRPSKALPQLASCLIGGLCWLMPWNEILLNQTSSAYSSAENLARKNCIGNPPAIQAFVYLAAQPFYGIVLIWLMGNEIEVQAIMDSRR